MKHLAVPPRSSKSKNRRYERAIFGRLLERDKFLKFEVKDAAFAVGRDAPGHPGVRATNDDDDDDDATRNEGVRVCAGWFEQGAI